MSEEIVLRDFGHPVDGAVVVNSLDEIFAHAYEPTYEHMCLADHEIVNSLCGSAVRDISAAEHYFKQMWEHCQNAEICGIYSDDLMALKALENYGYALTDFQRQRLGWYKKGRFPCGYRGEFPNGTWIVA